MKNRKGFQFCKHEQALEDNTIVDEKDQKQDNFLLKNNEKDIFFCESRGKNGSEGIISHNY